MSQCPLGVALNPKLHVCPWGVLLGCLHRGNYARRHRVCIAGLLFVVPQCETMFCRWPTTTTPWQTPTQAGLLPSSKRSPRLLTALAAPSLCQRYLGLSCSLDTLVIGHLLLKSRMPYALLLSRQYREFQGTDATTVHITIARDFASHLLCLGQVSGGFFTSY